MSLFQRLRRVNLAERCALTPLTGSLMLELRTLTYVHVGSGEERLNVVNRARFYRLAQDIRSQGVSALDRAARELLEPNVVTSFFDVVRYGDKICIPGSTIKGLVRSRLELMAGERGSGSESSACFSVPGRPLTALPPVGAHGWRHARIWDPSVRVNRESEASEAEGLCPVCNLFGNPRAASRVSFWNFCTSADNLELVDAGYGMRLLSIKPGTVLAGGLDFWGIKLSELGLLLIGLGYDGSEFKPVLIGRLKYAHRSFGKAVFEPRRMRLKVIDARILEELGTSDRRGDIVEVYGGTLSRLLQRAFIEARQEFPDVSPFSEAEQKQSMAGQLNLRG